MLTKHWSSCFRSIHGNALTAVRLAGDASPGNGNVLHHLAIREHEAGLVVSVLPCFLWFEDEVMLQDLYPEVMKYVIEEDYKCILT